MATDWYSSIVCGLTGCGGQVRINAALEDIGKQWVGGDDGILVIDITGFSRGAAQSVELANAILKNGIPGVPQDKILINGAYLFDTVGSTGIPGNNIDMGYTLSVPNVVPVFHATADNEYRALFGLQSQLYSDGSSPANVVQQGFLGAHSDIGGGYAPKEQGKDNTLSLIPLQWMHEQAVGNSAPLAPIPLQYQVPTELQNLYDAAKDGNKEAMDELNKNYIHDSRYIWERWQDRDSRPVYYPRGANHES